MIEVGACVIAYLSAPREQMFGVVLSLNASGVVLRGMSLASVEEWLRELTPEMDALAGNAGLATTFYPMHRLEKLALDETSYGAPAIHQRFEERAGVSLAEFMAQE